MNASAEFDIRRTVLYRCLSDGAEITVPDGVTEIAGFQEPRRIYDTHADRYVFVRGPGAFTGCGTVRRVHLPESLRKLGPGAFQDCVQLQSVDFPPDMDFVGEAAFRNTALRSVSLPAGLDGLPAFSFAECGQLETVTFPPRLRYIGESAFEGCLSLRSARLPEGVVSVGAAAFAYCRLLRELSLPDSVAQAGERLCSGCSALEKLRFPARLPERLFCGSAWYIQKQLLTGNCPACGEKLDPESKMCGNPNCPTQYGKWER